MQSTSALLLSKLGASQHSMSLTALMMLAGTHMVLAVLYRTDHAAICPEAAGCAAGCEVADCVAAARILAAQGHTAPWSAADY